MPIETPIKYLASATSKLCYLAAYACAGGKVALGAGHKVASFAISFTDKQKADAWNKTGDEYLTSAKKTAIRDLKITSGLILTGFALSRFGTFETPTETYGKALGIPAFLGTLFLVKTYAPKMFIDCISEQSNKVRDMTIRHFIQPLIPR